MFKQLFTAPPALERYSRAPLQDERLRYLTHCATRGSTRSSLRLIAQHQLVLIDYLHLQTAGSVTVEQIKAAADLWVNRKPQTHAHNAIDHRWARWRFISDARQWLGFLGRLRTIETPRRPYTHLIEGFRDHMIREKGSDLDAAVSRKGNQDGYARTSIQSYINALRAFFYYAEAAWLVPPGAGGRNHVGASFR